MEPGLVVTAPSKRFGSPATVATVCAWCPPEERRCPVCGVRGCIDCPEPAQVSHGLGECCRERVRREWGLA